jgi:hypothetical protein
MRPREFINCGQKCFWNKIQHNNCYYDIIMTLAITEGDIIIISFPKLNSKHRNHHKQPGITNILVRSFKGQVSFRQWI